MSNKYIKKCHPETRIIEPQETFNNCIIGYNKKTHSLIYDYDSLIQNFMQFGMTYFDAMEHVNYNILPTESMEFFPEILEDSENEFEEEETESEEETETDE